MENRVHSASLKIWRCVTAWMSSVLQHNNETVENNAMSKFSDGFGGGV